MYHLCLCVVCFQHRVHRGSYCATTTANMQTRMREIEDARGGQCRQAVWTRGCGGISADLTFLLLFWSNKKAEEKNMNGRLYDPVIARFFSPDNFVQIPEFTQSFNRYNCPICAIYVSFYRKNYQEFPQRL